MFVSVIGTLKKNSDTLDQWFSLLIREYGKVFYLPIFFKSDQEIPLENHRIHVRCRGTLFKDKRTGSTRLSLKEAVVMEDLGVDEIYLLEKDRFYEKFENELALIDKDIGKLKELEAQPLTTTQEIEKPRYSVGTYFDRDFDESDDLPWS